MQGYFSFLPNINYVSRSNDRSASDEIIPVKNIFKRAKIRDDMQNVVTAFEILEHLVAPFNVLRKIRAKKLIASVPLRLWFAASYKSKSDNWDRHFHEFEDWQVDWVLEKTGWKIIAAEKWINPPKSFGLRSLLRYFIPRYYIVYAKKIKNKS